MKTQWGMRAVRFDEKIVKLNDDDITNEDGSKEVVKLFKIYEAKIDCKHIRTKV